MKKEIKHNCPDGKDGNVKQHFDDKLGRCVNKEYSEDPNSRSKASSPLVFPTHKKRGEIQKI